jgi:hypothetical protein
MSNKFALNEPFEGGRAVHGSPMQILVRVARLRPRSCGDAPSIYEVVAFVHLYVKHDRAFRFYIPFDFELMVPSIQLLRESDNVLMRSPISYRSYIINISTEGCEYPFWS